MTWGRDARATRWAHVSEGMGSAGLERARVRVLVHRVRRAKRMGRGVAGPTTKACWSSSRWLSTRTARSSTTTLKITSGHAGEPACARARNGERCDQAWWPDAGLRGRVRAFAAVSTHHPTTYQAAADGEHTCARAPRRRPAGTVGRHHQSSRGKETFGNFEGVYLCGGPALY